MHCLVVTNTVLSCAGKGHVCVCVWVSEWVCVWVCVLLLASSVAMPLYVLSPQVNPIHNCLLDKQINIKKGGNRKPERERIIHVPAWKPLSDYFILKPANHIVQHSTNRLPTVSLLFYYFCIFLFFPAFCSQSTILPLFSFFRDNVRWVLKAIG